MWLPIFLHILDVGVYNSTENIHYKSQDIERMELNSPECEESHDGLYDRLGHPHHAGGESRAHGSTHELRPGENTAGDDQGDEDGEEAGLHGGESFSDLVWLS